MPGCGRIVGCGSVIGGLGLRVPGVSIPSRAAGWKPRTAAPAAMLIG